MKYAKMFAAALLVMSGLLTGCKSAQKMAQVAQVKDPTMDYSQFVNVTDVVPDAILEIRYFSTYNFVGARIDGYEEPVALMTRVAASAMTLSNMATASRSMMPTVLSVAWITSCVGRWIRVTPSPRLISIPA